MEADAFWSRYRQMKTNGTLRQTPEPMKKHERSTRDSNLPVERCAMPIGSLVLLTAAILEIIH